MTSTRPTVRRPLALALALAGSAALSACGSSPHKNPAASANQGIRFSACMRSHGIPSFPDPGPGGGIQITQSSGIKPFSPAFKTAQNACQKLLPGGGPGQSRPSAQRKEQLVRLAECMRAHGLSSFPDPTSGPPAGGPPPGGGLAFGSPGAFLSVPESLIRSPGFQQDAAACGFPMPGHAVPKPGGTGR